MGVEQSIQILSCKGERLECVSAQCFVKSCMDWVLGRVVDRSHFGSPVGHAMVSWSLILFVRTKAIIPVESLEVVVMALEILNKFTN